jgi:N-acyl-D-amino-acid deacylase
MNRPHFDVVLRNGFVVDGTGRPGIAVDLAIAGSRIAKIGRLEGATAALDIDVRGLIVSPGFIDVHTHDDAALIVRPQMTPKVTQGVTTVIAGNCGISAAPYDRRGPPPGLLRLIFKSDHCVAATFAGYVKKVRDAAPAVNAAFLTGHSTLRMQVMGDDLSRPATRDEVRQMRDLQSDCLQQGSLGLSTGLFYPAARAASTDEVVEVAKPLGAYGGVYTSHIRDEADEVIDGLQEALLIGREAGVPTIISHHKCMGRRNFGRSVETLALLDDARQHQHVAWDVYPYSAASTLLSAELVAQSCKTLVTWCDPHPKFSARYLEDVAHELGCTLMEAVAKLQPAGAVYFLMDEADVTRIISSTSAMIGSDGLPEDLHPHPRLWGTFPRVLGEYVRERGVLTLESAIHRMTGMSAHNFGLRDRGQLTVGKYADVCVFDAATIRDAATFEQPTRPALGMHYVFVNGSMALANGAQTATRAGMVLLRQGAGKGLAEVAAYPDGWWNRL